MVQVMKKPMALKPTSVKLKSGNLPKSSDNGLILRSASKADRNNFDVVHAAVMNDSHALEFASNNLKRNHKLVMAAFHAILGNASYSLTELDDRIATLWKHMSPALKKDAKFMTELLSQAIQTDPAEDSVLDSWVLTTILEVAGPRYTDDYPKLMKKAVDRVVGLMDANEHDSDFYDDFEKIMNKVAGPKCRKDKTFKNSMDAFTRKKGKWKDEKADEEEKEEWIASFEPDFDVEVDGEVGYIEEEDLRDLLMESDRMSSKEVDSVLRNTLAFDGKISFEDFEEAMQYHYGISK